MKDQSAKDNQEGKAHSKFTKEKGPETTPSTAIVKDEKALPKEKKEVENLIVAEEKLKGGISYGDFKNLFSFTIGMGGFFLFYFF